MRCKFIILQKNNFCIWYFRLKTNRDADDVHHFIQEKNTEGEKNLISYATYLRSTPEDVWQCKVSTNFVKKNRRIIQVLGKKYNKFYCKLTFFTNFTCISTTGLTGNFSKENDIPRQTMCEVPTNPRTQYPLPYFENWTTN